jgi:hypothetical protein
LLFEIKQKIFLKFRKQAQRNSLAALVHQINLMTSKVVELDPQNPEHYAIVNVNRNNNSSPIDWTYADVVMGRIKFHQGRTPVGNVWGVQQNVEPARQAFPGGEMIEQPRKVTEVKHVTTVEGDRKAPRDARPRKDRKPQKKVVEETVERVVKSSGAQTHQAPTTSRVQSQLEEVQTLHQAPANISELHDEGYTDEHGRTYAEILKGMREASGVFFATQSVQTPETSRINIERTHHFIANEKTMNAPKPPPRRHKQAAVSDEVTKTVERTVTQYSQAPESAETSSRVDNETKKKTKRFNTKRRHPEQVDGNGESSKKYQETHSETSSTSGEDIQERREKPKKKHDKKKNEKTTDAQSANDSNIDRNIATKRIILITHEAVNKVPVQQIHLSLPQTYAVKVEKPKQDIQAVSVETVVTYVEKIKMEPEPFEEETIRSGNRFPLQHSTRSLKGQWISPWKKR